jgi:hypothetical protein
LPAARPHGPKIARERDQPPMSPAVKPSARCHISDALIVWLDEAVQAIILPAEAADGSIVVGRYLRPGE